MAENFDAETLALAQPQPASEAKISCWYMDSSDEDQRKPHKQEPNKPASIEAIRKLGVISWKLDADKYENDQQLEAIRKVRGYSYQDIIEVCPERLPGYEDKIKTFFEEHIHDDEEIRYILAGSGYFDVRDHEDQWIRIECNKGDMIVLPEGIYHRFTLDENNYIKAMRLFVGDPVWTPINRKEQADSHPARAKYLQMLQAA
eukprot:TRINITY_DN28171_c0_g1_i2.p1 TRINITY_DN28171_c0_g1~~TRINITY_DN28171_c0_g1_i2.p1  ORF type:complete len:202 (-),score=29.33 TRINITY_DN28171_c0_g1_i2:231-836(-)